MDKVLGGVLTEAFRRKGKTEEFCQFLHDTMATLFQQPDMAYFSDLTRSREDFAQHNPYNNVVAFKCRFENGDHCNDYRIKLRSGEAVVSFKTNYDLPLLEGNAQDGVASVVPLGNLKELDAAAILIRLAEVDPIFGEHFWQASETVPQGQPRRKLAAPRKPERTRRPVVA